MQNHVAGLVYPCFYDLVVVCTQAHNLYSFARRLSLVAIGSPQSALPHFCRFVADSLGFDFLYSVYSSSDVNQRST